jgi:ABC-2 type transport system ATP-binding protein
MTPRGIQLDALVRRYGKTTALDGVDLWIQPGTLVCLLGRNGAGKTTALETIAGLQAPTKGDVRIAGVSVRSDRIHHVRRRLGYLPQTPALYEQLTGREFLRFIGELYEVAPGTLALLDERIATMEMSDAADSPIRTYSVGMKKKIAWLSSILNEPDFLVLDEPFVSLDAVAARRVKETMLRFRDEGRVVLFATHTLEIAERFGDRLAILDGGRLLFQGSVEALRAQHGGCTGETLETLFLRLTGAKCDGSSARAGR